MRAPMNYSALASYRAGTTGWRSGSLRPPAVSPQMLMCGFCVLRGLRTLFRHRRRKCRYRGQCSTIVGSTRHRRARISPAIPAWSSQGRERWYYSASRVSGNRRTVQTGSLLWISELGEYHFEPGDVYTIVLTDITDSGDDYQGAEETTGAVAVGGSVTGNLEVDNDVDPFRVRLEADKSYRIRMRGSESGGGTLADPYRGGIVRNFSTHSALVITAFGGFTALRTTTIGATTEKGQRNWWSLSITSKDYLHLTRQASRHRHGHLHHRGGRGDPPRWARGRTARRRAGRASPGTVQAGETLTATTDGIEDEDGLTGTVFAYQWVRSGTDIEGAASSNYTVTGDDEGKPIQVRVTFTDDAGNAESLTSYAKLSAPPLIIPDEEPPPESTATREAREAQGAQEAAETPLTAAIHDAPESHDGQEDFTFELRFSEEPKEGFSYLTLQDHAFTVTGGDGGRGPAAGRGQRHLQHPVGDQRQPGLQRERHRSLCLSPTDCEAQGAICTDDGTTLSSPLEFTVKGPPLTASTVSVPTSHNGSGEFRFRIAFSEEFSLSYKTLRDDHVFTVEGGKVTGARRLVKGSNIGWEIVVKPDSNGDVTITLPATTDCDGQGAICADGDKKLSNRLELTVSGSSR